jgi:hypothetical protein
MTLKSLIIFVAYKNEVNPRSRYRDSIPSVRSLKAGNASCCLPTYPATRPKTQLPRRRNCMDNYQQNELWAMMFALIFFALLSLYGPKSVSVGRAINCELRNHQFQCARFPFSSIRRAVISCENSKRSHSLGTSITVAESRHHFVDCV